MFDFVVVGGGAAGCYSCYLLSKQFPKSKILLLEGSERIGGRTETIEHDNHKMDIGAQWIATEELQPRVNKLIKEFNLKTVDQNHGKGLFYINQKVFDFDENSSKDASMEHFPDYLKGVECLESLSNQFITNVEKPWLSPNAKENDLKSIEYFTSKLDANSRALMEGNLRCILGCEPTELSYLFILWSLKMCRGYSVMSDSHNAAQHATVINGTQQISQILVEKFKSNNGQVRLNSKVVQIKQLSDKTKITTSSPQGNFSQFETRFVIIAIPTPHCSKISFYPNLPAARDLLSSRMRMGAIIKCIIFYKTPFWRENEYCGEIFTDSEPVANFYDDSSFDGKVNAMVGLIAGKDALKFSKFSKKKEAVVSQLIAIYGEKARNPTDYIDKDWTSDDWSRGAYFGVMPPNTLFALGENLKKPIGRIFWAGTETATEWPGYIEGALQSAERVTKEISETIQQQNSKL